MHPLASPRTQHANPPRPLDSQTTSRRNRIRPSTSSPPRLANPSGYSIPKLEHLFVELLFVLHEELRAIQGMYPWTMGQGGEPATPPSSAMRTQRSPSCANATLPVVCESYVSAASLSITAQNPIGGTETTKPPMHHRIRGFTRTYSFDTAGTHQATGSRSCGRSPPTQEASRRSRCPPTHAENNPARLTPLSTRGSQQNAPLLQAAWTPSGRLNQSASAQAREATRA